MDKVLNTPELIGKIISYLPLKRQCLASQINRTWYLEVRYQFYQNRKRFINRLLRRRLTSNGLEVNLNKAIAFINALNLNVVDELEEVLAYYKWKIQDLGKKYKEATKELL